MSQGDLLRTFASTGQFGPIRAGTHFDLHGGYTVLVGANNAGKSSVLQWLFRTLVDDGAAGWGAETVAFIPTDREWVAASHETGGYRLAQWNNEIRSQLGDTPLRYDSPRSNANGLPRLLLTDVNMTAQLGRAEAILERLGLPVVRIGGGQLVYFEDIEATLQGSGLRSLYPIVAAMTHSQLKVILVDEPELSLEPTLQKAVRDLLVEHAEDGPAVVVSTHSHLFLDRRTVNANHVVSRFEEGVQIERITEESRLLDVVFRLLGNSTADSSNPRVGGSNPPGRMARLCSRGPGTNVHCLGRRAMPVEPGIGAPRGATGG